MSRTWIIVFWATAAVCAAIVVVRAGAAVAMLAGACT